MFTWFCIRIEFYSFWRKKFVNQMKQTQRTWWFSKWKNICSSQLKDAISFTFERTIVSYRSQNVLPVENLMQLSRKGNKTQDVWKANNIPNNLSVIYELISDLIKFRRGEISSSLGILFNTLCLCRITDSCFNMHLPGKCYIRG